MGDSDNARVYEQELITNLQRQKKELKESLEYAKNIQKAILPPVSNLDQLFSDNFILFLPRDIVSGDFYWFRKIDEFIVFTVADCTGHGVPGAFMSILGITFLNEITNHYPLLPANRILNALRERIMKTLNQTGKDREQKDGMDLSLCIYDEPKGTLQYAGANNPLYLLRESNIQQIKGDKMPIGVSGVVEESFKNHEIQIEKGDRIYMFTDGYADQFGGEQDQKFKIKRFRELLIDTEDLGLKQQKESLKKTIMDWKGERDQIDDILVMGIGF
jgi:serine phosphatase RsbU (regulator of sigma subunit)